MVQSVNEQEVTYPLFFNDPAGTLYFMFRDGVSGNGNSYFYIYDEGATTWSAAAGTGSNGKLLDGKNSSGLESPYWWNPVFDDDFGLGGYMHLFYSWRSDGSSGQYNHDIGYVRWDGTDFTTEADSSATTPITTANDNVVQSIAVNSGLQNTGRMDADGNGRPHLAYLRSDGNGWAQLWHLWFNGASWVELQISDSAGATPYFPIYMSRPCIAIDRSANVAYIIYRDGYKAGRFIAYVSDPDDFATWTEVELVRFNLGEVEPNFDEAQWRVDNSVLYIYVQAFGGEGYCGSATAYVLEWTL
jgi:hypothetical protein